MALAIVTVWLRAEPSKGDVEPVVMAESAMPAAAAIAPGVVLKGVWKLTSPQRRFGGFSAIVVPGDRRLRLYTDFGSTLQIAVPQRAQARYIAPLRLVGDDTLRKTARDIEAAVLFDGVTWFGLEHINAIEKRGSDGQRIAIVEPEAMSDWRANGGPEALARLDDGRFIVLEEGRVVTFDPAPLRGLLFEGDPTVESAVQSFELEGDRHFRPVDMATLPDGRVLVLLRKMSIGLPIAFTSRLAWFDVESAANGRAELHTIADLDALPNDNYEGLALVANDSGLRAWLVSDDNNSHFQATWLAELALNPELWPTQ